MTVNPTADAYVSSTSPTTNFGTAKSLRVGSSPIYRSYLTFGVSLPLVTHAVLRLYPTSSDSTGFSISAVSDTSWGEKTITFDTAPAFAANAVASTGAVKRNKWVSLDVSSLVQTSGLVSFALTSTSASVSTVSLASREAGTKPQLLLTGVTTPSAPTGVAAVAGDGAATVSWQAPSSDGGSAVTSYVVVSTPGGAVTAPAGTEPSLTVTGLTNGTTYQFTVAAVNVAGTGPPSAPSNPVTPAAVLTAPVAAFTVSPTSGTAPLPVTVTDTSTGTVTSRSWDFGDGATATGASATHTYADAGVYAITLTVENGAGSSQATHTVDVSSPPLPTPPSASFVCDTTSGVAPLTVAFEDRSTGTIDTWAWDFGDGTTDARESPVHTFASAGTYVVTLVVTNGGGSSQATEIVTVSPATPTAPTAAFTVDVATGVAPLTVWFTDSSAGVIASWRWDFGDGATDTAQNPHHSFTTSGVYTVALTVTNAGGSSTAERSITVTSPPPPSASFDVAPAAGPAPLEVRVQDTSTGSPTDWTWNFGDGTADITGTSAATHTYSTSGSYVVTLTASNASGATTATRTVDVYAPPAATLPDPPGNVAATLISDTSARVTFTPPADDGGAAIDEYRVTATPVVGSGWTGVASPITVTGLQPDSSVRFTVAAHNSVGWSAESMRSNVVHTEAGSSPPPTPTLQPVSYWQARFDAQDASFYNAGVDKTTTGDSWDFYNGAYYIDGYVSMFEATGQTGYLDRALTLTDNMISSAKPSSTLVDSSFKDSFYGWASYLNTQTGNEIPLYESYAWRYVTEMLRAMHDDAAVMADPSYKARYDSILAFTQQDIFDKWFTRGVSTNIYRSRTHMASHWAFIALDLSRLSTDDARISRYVAVVDDINLHLPNYSGASLRGQLVPTAEGGYFWSDVWGSFEHPGQGVSHGNGVISYVTEAAWLGYEWTSTDMTRFATTLRETIWPVEGNGAEYVDGTGNGNGWFNDGFVKLGAFDTALQIRLQGHPGGGQFIAAMALNAARLLGGGGR